MFGQRPRLTVGMGSMAASPRLSCARLVTLLMARASGPGSGTASRGVSATEISSDIAPQTMAVGKCHTQTQSTERQEITLRVLRPGMITENDGRGPPFTPCKPTSVLPPITHAIDMPDKVAHVHRSGREDWPTVIKQSRTCERRPNPGRRRDPRLARLPSVHLISVRTGRSGVPDLA